jgi:GNAT superfamily N-acetyltransferase
MRANEFLNETTQLDEIERLSRDDYTGGKGELDMYKAPGEKKLVPLPGGSGLMYSIKSDSDGTRQFIFIVDPKAVPTQPIRGRFEYNSEYKDRVDKWKKSKGKPAPTVVAKLSIEVFSSPIPNAVQVGSITVDEDYRGMGLAKALYGIVLTIMKKTLVAGGEQTPGGRRNWLSLASIPGVEVKGFTQIDTDDIDFNPNDWPDSPVYQHAMKEKEKFVDAIHNDLMRLGGQFIGKNKYAEYWAFDVVPGKGELAPAVKTAISKLYSNAGYEQTGMYAKWVG